MDLSLPEPEEADRPVKRRKVEMPNGEIQSRPNTTPTQTHLRKSQYLTQTKHVVTQSDHLKSSYNSVTNKYYAYAHPPPTKDDLLLTLAAYNIPNRIYRSPYYSHFDDAPSRPREYASLVYRLKGGDGLDTLSVWENYASLAHDIGFAPGKTFDPSGIGGWEYAGFPPNKKVVQRWLLENPVLLPPKQIVSHSQVRDSLSKWKGYNQ